MIIDLVQQVLRLAVEVYQICEEVQCNQATCREIANSVRIIDGQLASLNEHYPDTRRFQEGIEALLSALTDAKALMSEYKNKRTLLKIIRRSSHAEDFDAIKAQLAEALQLLGFGLEVETVINQARMQEAQREDRQHLLSIRDDIATLYQESLQQHQQVISAVAAVRQDSTDMQIMLERLMQKQADSMMVNFEEMIRAQMAQAEPGEGETKLSEGEPPRPPQPYSIIHYHELTFQTLLATGQLGEVWLGSWSGSPVVIKTLESDAIHAHPDVLQREMTLMYQLVHPNIVRCFGGVIAEGHACLVMEHMVQGDLKKYLLEHADLSMTKRLDIALDIARGLQYMHSQGQLHGAICSHHVLLSDTLVAKLVDFQSSNHEMQTLQSIQPSSGNTVRWYAPERMDRSQSRASTPQDVYGFGIVLWEIVTGREPFANLSDQTVIERVSEGYRDSVPATLAPELGELIQRCWAQIPEERPTIEEVLAALQQCKSDSPETIYERGVQCETVKQYEAACGYYQQAADKAYPKAFTALGMFALKGKGGLRKDKLQAFQFFSEGVNHGHARAMLNQAVMLEKGDGVPQDLDRAATLYEQLIANQTPYAEHARQRLQNISAKRSAQGVAAPQVP